MPLFSGCLVFQCEHSSFFLFIFSFETLIRNSFKEYFAIPENLSSALNAGCGVDNLCFPMCQKFHYVWTLCTNNMWVPPTAATRSLAKLVCDPWSTHDVANCPLIGPLQL